MYIVYSIFSFPVLSLLFIVATVPILQRVSASIRCAIRGTGMFAPFAERTYGDVFRSLSDANRLLGIVVKILAAFGVLFGLCCAIGGDFLVYLGFNKDIRLKAAQQHYSYYVEATNEEGATYILPAQVTLERKFGGGSDGKIILDTIYFNNGGYLDFTDQGEEIKLDKPTEVTHYGEISSDDWTVTLINKPIETDKFTVGMGYRNGAIIACTVVSAIFSYYVMGCLIVYWFPKLTEPLEIWSRLYKKGKIDDLMLLKLKTMHQLESSLNRPYPEPKISDVFNLYPNLRTLSNSAENQAYLEKLADVCCKINRETLLVNDYNFIFSIITVGDIANAHQNKFIDEKQSKLYKRQLETLECVCVSSRSYLAELEAERCSLLSKLSI